MKKLIKALRRGWKAGAQIPSFTISVLGTSWRAQGWFAVLMVSMVLIVWINQGSCLLVPPTNYESASISS